MDDKYIKPDNIKKDIEFIIEKCKKISDDDMNNDVSIYRNKYFSLINFLNSVTTEVLLSDDFLKLGYKTNDAVTIYQYIIKDYSILLINLTNSYIGLDYNDIILYANIINTQINILKTYIDTIGMSKIEIKGE